jgi:hypothetical protein
MRIETDFSYSVIAPLLMTIFFTYVIWHWLVPRSLRGLQVSFPRSKNQYEVHVVTESIDDVRALLGQPKMRFGIAIYLMAIAGAILFFFEWLFTQTGLKDHYDGFNLALAGIFVLIPGISSVVVSLGKQVLREKSDSKATLQDTSLTTHLLYVVLAVIWVGMNYVLINIQLFDYMSMSGRRATFLFMVFLPAVIAYGRILGSSWLPLFQSNRKLSRGEPSDLHPAQPTLRRQFSAMILTLTAFLMPFTALNALLSVIMIILNPEMFVHSPQVLALPEYTVQASVMEEGGVLGFYAIELFSNIGERGVREPLVVATLLFLLLNVAIVGVVFVYEVAHILFLGLFKIAGKGGLQLADQRLLRADPTQQAKVLNFCFSGFAGQSMLLFVLAMITFWDSAYLPQGSECGVWEDNICVVLEKDLLEQFTWMLAAGGQIAFLLVWFPSWNERHRLDDIVLDAGAGDQRAIVHSHQDKIFLKQTSFEKLIRDDDWERAIERYDHMEATPDGIEFARRQRAKMVFDAAQGCWDGAEESAVSLLALRGGDSDSSAGLILFAASLAQRDYDEARPRQSRMPQNSHETVALRWLAAILSPETMPFDDKLRPSAAMMSVIKMNIDLIKRWSNLEPWSLIGHKNDYIGRHFLLGDVARMRILGQSGEALNRLEFWIKDNDVEGWVMGDVARSLLYLDRGMKMTAIRIMNEIIKVAPHHPAVRELQRLANQIRIIDDYPDTMNRTEFDWISPDVSRDSWVGIWFARYTVMPLPIHDLDPRLELRYWDANGWALAGEIKESGAHPAGMTLRKWRRSNSLPKNQPLGNYLILKGLATTIGGMPVDIGMPTELDPEAAKTIDLLNL